jgi:pimeloyl-ACP methyl ester carboxylesterase
MTDTNSNPTTPDTIVLVHGFWVTPRSWEGWKAHYEAKGFRVLTPAYPGFEVEVEALNADTTPITELTVPAIIEHLESVVAGLDTPPIIIGHSAGGAFTQVLLDHGYGAAGVAINSAPTEGVRVTPPSQLKAALPVLKNPANHHKAVGLTPKQWKYDFTGTFTDEESRRLYDRYHVPASGRIFWNSVLANFQPGHQDTWVDYRNEERAPLLFVSGSEDKLMPPAIQRSNLKKYKGTTTVTERVEYEGMAHLLPAQEGWEQVADDVLEWALAQAAQHASTKASSATIAA